MPLERCIMTNFRCMSLIIILSVLLIAGSSRGAGTEQIDGIAELYVKLVLEIGLYEPDYADTYFGPPEWQPPESQIQDEFPSERLGRKVNELIEKLGYASKSEKAGKQSARFKFLEKQLLAVKAKIDLLAGKEMSFDEESRVLYDIVAPAFDKKHFDDILKKLDDTLPGEGSLNERFDNYAQRFLIPENKLEPILKAAVKEYRRRVVEHIKLPPKERLEFEFVGFEPWAANLDYRGNGSSVLQINANMPFYLADVAIMIRHEGYPGHHIHMTMIEQRLYRDNNWVEYSVIPANTPLALIAEGIAEYGCRDLLGNGPENLKFAREVLFPLAGFDPAEAEKYFEIIELKDKLDSAMIEAARQYIDGKMSHEQAHDWLEQYCLLTFSGAESLLRFIDRYRSYVVNYALGRYLVKNYINSKCGTDNTADRRWEIFNQLLSTPITPSELIEACKTAGQTENH